jgi:OmpA-OmpF porin, OOP family
MARSRILAALAGVVVAMHIGAEAAARAPVQLALSPADWIVLFDRGSADLNTPATVVLQDFLQAAQFPELGQRPILLVGHSDTFGEPLANLALSCQRAAAVRNYLIAAGVAADRIIIEGRGETTLAVPTGDGASNQANRRVVVILDPSLDREWRCDGF